MQETTEPVRVLLFDMMNTLLREPYYEVVERLLPDPSVRTLYFESRNREAFQAFEKGEISEEEYFKIFYTDAREEFPSPKKVKKELFRSVTYLPGMEELVRSLSLRRDLKLGIASNYSPWYEEIFKKRRELEELFDYLFFSCEMGIRKPEEGYYETVADALRGEGFGAEEILFLDDLAENLKPARRRGWKTFLVDGKSSPESWIRRNLGGEGA